MGLAERYEPLRELGRGGFGRVVLARDRQLERQVAVKVLDAALDDPDLRERFDREARLTSRLEHPGIVRLYDHGVDVATDQAWIAYEFIRGHDLSSLDLPMDDVEILMAWGREVAEALAVAHEAGVVHRDIKPENVLLRDGTDPVLCDFGIARTEGGATVHTQEGILLGTPTYIAPELWEGAPPSPASDQYAWAATLYELAYGRRLHPDGDPWAVYDRVREGFEIEFGAPGMPAVPGLERALARALAPDPADRFPDMRAFARALGREVTRERSASWDQHTVNLAAPPPAAPATTRRTLRPRRLPWGRLALLLGGALVAGWLSGEGGPGQPPSPEPREARRAEARERLADARARLDSRVASRRTTDAHWVRVHLPVLLDPSYPPTLERMTEALAEVVSLEAEAGNLEARAPELGAEVVHELLETFRLMRGTGHQLEDPFRASEIFGSLREEENRQAHWDRLTRFRRAEGELEAVGGALVARLAELPALPEALLQEVAPLAAILGHPSTGGFFRDLVAALRSPGRDPGHLAALGEALQQTLRSRVSTPDLPFELAREAARTYRRVAADLLASPPRDPIERAAWSDGVTLLAIVALAHPSEVQAADIDAFEGALGEAEALLACCPEARETVFWLAEDLRALRNRKTREIHDRAEALVDGRVRALEERAQAAGSGT